MELKKLIIKEINRNGFTTAKSLMLNTGLSRVYIHRILTELIDDGQIALIGNTRRARYVFLNSNIIRKEKSSILSSARKLYPLKEKVEEHAVLDELKRNSGIFNNIRKNIEDIVDYAFSEMLNNALEHSRSEEINIFMNRENNKINFKVHDSGIGIFNSIRSKFGLTTDDAIGELLKGKITTDPERHTGEGIFFTSKAADHFTIHGQNKKIIFNNVIDDKFIRTVSEITGTRVVFSISEDSSKVLSGIFRVYTDDEFEFNNTIIAVKLYRFSEKFISRSQARRIVSGLDKFKTITLDFKGIDTVGQGFADEIFRVWKEKNPGREIKIINASDDVRFMIERAKPGS